MHRSPFEAHTCLPSPPHEAGPWGKCVICKFSMSLIPINMTRLSYFPIFWKFSERFHENWSKMHFFPGYCTTLTQAKATCKKWFSSRIILFTSEISFMNISLKCFSTTQGSANFPCGEKISHQILNPNSSVFVIINQSAWLWVYFLTISVVFFWGGKCVVFMESQ